MPQFLDLAERVVLIFCTLEHNLIDLCKLHLDLRLWNPVWRFLFFLVLFLLTFNPDCLVLCLVLLSFLIEILLVKLKELLDCCPFIDW